MRLSVYCLFMMAAPSQGALSAAYWEFQKDPSMWLFHLHSAVKSISKLRSAYRTEFHLHNTVKRQPFSPGFPLAESIAKAFSGYSFGISRKKASTLF